MSTDPVCRQLAHNWCIKFQLCNQDPYAGLEAAFQRYNIFNNNSVGSKRIWANPIKQSLLQEAIAVLLLKKAIEKVSKKLSPGFYSFLFLIPKAPADGDLWSISVFSINSWTYCPSKWKHRKGRTGVNGPRHSIYFPAFPGSFLISQIPNTQIWLKTRMDVYQFWATPFGLATILLLFSKEIKCLVTSLDRPSTHI